MNPKPESQPPPAQVLIVDDEKSIRRTLGEFLREAGYAVTEAEDAEAALRCLHERSLDVVVSDIILPRVNGVELLRRIQAADPRVLVVMMTGEPTVETATESLRAGAADYLFKPISKSAILRAVGSAVRLKSLEDAKRQLEVENRAHRENLERFVGERTKQLRASEVRYRSLVETAFDWVWEVDAECRYTYASPRVFDLLGYHPEEVLGRTPFDLMPPQEAQRIKEACDQLVARREPFVLLENTNRHRDGRLVVLETSGTPIFKDDGTFLGYHGMDRDITERKLAEAIRETMHSLATLLSEARTPTDVARSIFNQADRLWHWDAGTFGLCFPDSGTAETVLCVDIVAGERRELPASEGRGAMTPRLRRILAQAAELILRDPRGLLASDSVPFGDTSRLSASIMTVPIRWRAQPIGYLSIQSYTPNAFTDAELLTLQGLADHCGGALERIRAEEASQAERTLLRALVEHLPLAIYAKDTRGRKTLVNPVDARNMGLASSEEALGKTDFDFFPREQAEMYRADEEQVMKLGKSVLNREEVVNRPDGTSTWLLTSKVPLIDATGHITGLVGIGLDITERRQAEEHLRKLARAVEQSPVSIIITDGAGNIEFVNPKFTEVTGYTAEEVLGKNPRFLKSEETPAEEYRKLWDTITVGRDWRGEFHNRRKDGTLYWESASISPIRNNDGRISHFIAVKEDVTEKKLTAAKFLRAQRVDSIGSLASGIAHDLNNILTPILMCAPLLDLEETAAGRRELTQTIESSAQRAIGIVKQLLSFARGKDGQQHPVQVRHLVRDMAGIVRETFPRSIQVNETCAPDLWPVPVDATQLHQVLLNLCVNARDAMPNGGTLSMRASNVLLDDHFLNMHRDAQPGPYVRLEVEDTGTGIPESAQEHIFESFFTTKGEGQGTGLGLATVKGIVLDHRGFITYRTAPGKGTTFVIHLPGIPEGESPTTDGQSPSNLPRAQGELILVVDDEPAICETTRRALERQGYTVVQALDGIQALAQFTSHQSWVRAVVTDFMMPLLDGVTLARTVRALAPRTPIIVSSGGLFGKAGGAALRTFEELGIRHILHKPHTADILLQSLAQVLHGEKAAHAGHETP